jgi:septal ring factor EnvC (AmiA/AmiB activator)
MEIIEQYAANLAAVRQRKARLKEQLSALTEQLAKLPPYQALQTVSEELKRLNKMAEDLEGNLRSAALNWSQETGQTKHPAFTVKNFQVARYDPAVALDWCYQHFREALTVDAKRFEKAAQALKPAFVTLEVEQRVSIASDLSGFLPEAIPSEEPPFPVSTVE